MIYLGRNVEKENITHLFLFNIHLTSFIRTFFIDTFHIRTLFPPIYYSTLQHIPYGTIHHIYHTKYKVNRDLKVICINNVILINPILKIFSSQVTMLDEKNTLHDLLTLTFHIPTLLKFNIFH